MRRRHPRLRTGLIGVLLLIVMAGCGSRPKYAKVEGLVTMNGKPLNWAEVIFMPDPEKGTVGPRATAYTDENGRFTLDTRQSGKSGALVGIHRVCIRDLTAQSSPPLPPDENGNAPPPFKKTRALVSYDYRDPSKTPFRDVEVKLGEQTLNFDVTSQPGTAPRN